MAYRFHSSILSILPSSWLLLASIPLVAAQNTIANVVVGWEAGPDQRGTLSLVWGCVITTFACTWTVLHLNVPGRAESSWWRVFRKVKWMAINIVFPEFILSKAVCDLRLALNDLREFDEGLRENKPISESKRKPIAWTMAYGFNGVKSDGHEWCWKIKYPRQARLLYRLLGLQLPLPPMDSDAQCDPEAENAILTSPTSDSSELGASPDARGPDTMAKASGSGESEGMLQIKWRTQQEWTIVHSYYAQMGGLLYPEKGSEGGGEPVYYALTPSKLTLRYHWEWPNWDCDHPLMYLVLGERDIQDKSKADWLLKGMAVLQITWLVLSVAVRGITGLPVTQIEVSTIAFAIMAIAIYLANWWKPKDILQPTLLQAICFGYAGRVNTFDRTQQLTRRLWSPKEAAESAETIKDIERVPNDLVWMEGDTPLIITLMAVSSLVFGGLHCLAWNFEFPTQTELICWRVASLTTAILPVLTLGISLCLNYLSTKFIELKLISTLLAKLKPLEQLPPTWWELLIQPAFRVWEPDAKTAFLSISKGSRNWEQELSTDTVETVKAGGTWEDLEDAIWRYDNWSLQFRIFREHWVRVQRGDYTRPAQFRENWFETIKFMKEYIGGNDTVLDFCRDYEDFVSSKLDIPGTVMPNAACIDHILRAYDETMIVSHMMDALRVACTRASIFLTICSGILYTSARLMIIVLLFTCLRATPAGVYQNTSWTRFLPNIS